MGESGWGSDQNSSMSSSLSDCFLTVRTMRYKRKTKRIRRIWITSSSSTSVEVLRRRKSKKSRVIAQMKKGISELSDTFTSEKQAAAGNAPPGARQCSDRRPKKKGGTTNTSRSSIQPNFTLRTTKILKVESEKVKLWKEPKGSPTMKECDEEEQDVPDSAIEHDGGGEPSVLTCRSKVLSKSSTKISSPTLIIAESPSIAVRTEGRKSDKVSQTSIDDVKSPSIKVSTHPKAKISINSSKLDRSFTKDAKQSNSSQTKTSRSHYVKPSDLFIQMPDDGSEILVYSSAKPSCSEHCSTDDDGKGAESRCINIITCENLEDALLEAWANSDKVSRGEWTMAAQKEPPSIYCIADNSMEEKEILCKIDEEEAYEKKAENFATAYYNMQAMMTAMESMPLKNSHSLFYGAAQPGGYHATAQHAYSPQPPMMPPPAMYPTYQQPTYPTSYHQPMPSSTYHLTQDVNQPPRTSEEDCSDYSYLDDRFNKYFKGILPEQRKNEYNTVNIDSILHPSLDQQVMGTATVRSKHAHVKTKSRSARSQRLDKSREKTGLCVNRTRDFVDNLEIGSMPPEYKSEHNKCSIL